jgi:hypothetical protein
VKKKKKMMMVMKKKKRSFLAVKKMKEEEEEVRRKDLTVNSCMHRFSPWNPTSSMAMVNQRPMMMMMMMMILLPIEEASLRRSLRFRRSGTSSSHPSSRPCLASYASRR